MGREFIDLFDSWSETYDETVLGNDLEYREVFKGYQQILEKVALLADGRVVEFGAGTGNLTEKLIKQGHSVSAIEPSSQMRKIANEKVTGNVEVIDGDFLDFSVTGPIDSIVSTYAFHHLTDAEKTKAIEIYRDLLKSGGKIVFADTMYPSKEGHLQAIEDAKQEGFLALAKDLATEYYTTMPYLQSVLEANGFNVRFFRCNRFVWIMEAVKK